MAVLYVFLAACTFPTVALALPDGALDTRFNAGAGASDDVLTAASFPDGGWLLGGYFTSYGGQERWRLARLRPDGALDPAFDPGDSSGSAPVTQVGLSANGKILVAGAFSHFAGRPCSLVARLTPEGKVDNSFNPEPAFAGVSGRVNALAVLPPDGKSLVGGRFDSSAASRRQGSALLVRLLPDGALDPDFLCALLPQDREDQLTAFTVTRDGFSVVGTRTGIFRLSPDGKLDAAFQAAKESRGAVTALALQPDGKILAAIKRPTRGWQLLRLEPNGKLDPVFHLLKVDGEDAGEVARLLVQADGKILLGGSFRQVVGQRRHGLARLQADGSLDFSFEPGTGVEVIPLDEADETPEAVIRTLTLLPDGSLFVAGRFDLYNGIPCHNVAKLINHTAPKPTIAKLPPE